MLNLEYSGRKEREKKEQMIEIIQYASALCPSCLLKTYQNRCIEDEMNGSLYAALISWRRK